MARIPRVNVWKHPNGIYYIRYTYLGERRMISTRSADQVEAEMKRREYQDCFHRGQDPQVELERREIERTLNNMSLRNLWPEIERRHLFDKSDSTRELYRFNFDNLSKCRFKGGSSIVDIPMRELTRQIVNIYIDLRLRSGKKPATVNRDIQFLHAALNLAVDWGYLEQNPIVGMKKLTERNRRDVSNIGMEDLEAMLSKLPPVLADICEFAYYSWRRREEVLSLRIENVREVEIPTRHYVARYFVKGRKWAEFPLSSEAVKIFRRNAGNRKEGFVFLNSDTGDRYCNVTRTFGRHAREAKLRIATGEFICFHDLRRLAATDASRRGYSDSDIAEGLGHSRSGVTGRYTPGRRAPLEMFESQTRIRKEEKKSAVKEG